MRARAPSAIVLALLLAAAAASAKPQRIASLNLCTDQLLLMLVARERIATVTFLASDPATSYMADAAAGIAPNHGRLEEILPARPRPRAGRPLYHALHQDPARQARLPGL